MTTEASGKATYLDRYDPEDDGVRFMPGLELTLPALPPIPDGILGDKVLRQNLRTDLFKGPIPEETILRPQLTVAEISDFIQYWAWNTWDQLVLRASEGQSGLIPRQQYEALSFSNAWFRWPEFMNAMIEHTGGFGGVAELGAAGRQPASKLNMLHIWSMASPPLLGRALHLILDEHRPDEFMPELNTIIKFCSALGWGYRGDGHIFGSQARYTQQVLDHSWVQRFTESLEPVPPARSTFKKLMASAELLSFYVHLDCRLGMADLGPWPLENGNALIVRNIFLREDVYPWSLPCDGLPYAMVFAFEVDAEAAALEEIRCIDIGTLMTRPKDYVSAVVKGSLWVRDEWDSRLRRVDVEEARELWAAHIKRASLQIFSSFARTSRRHLLEQGAFVYYGGCIYPFLRELGLYETMRDEFKFWEFDERTSRLYYGLDRNQFAAVVVPTRLFDPKGSAFAPLDENAKTWRSKYSWV